MTEISHALDWFLRQLPALSSIVGEKIYREMIPKDFGPPPFVGTKRLDLGEIRSLDGDAGAATPEFSIEAWAATSEDRDALAVALIGVGDNESAGRIIGLNNFRAGYWGPAGNQMWVHFSQLSSPNGREDLYDPTEPDAGERGAWGVKLTVTIGHDT